MLKRHSLVALVLYLLSPGNVLAGPSDSTITGRNTLRDWKWAGEWGYNCSSERAFNTFTYKAISTDDSNILGTSTYVVNGHAQPSMNIIQASVQNGALNLLSVLETNQFTYTSQTLVLRNDDSMWLESATERYLAKQNIPPGLLIAAPGGVPKGQTLVIESAKDGLQTRYGITSPASVVHYCSDVESRP